MRTIPTLLLAAPLLALSFIAVAPVERRPERFRTLWHGQWVDYVEEGDFAVTDGDIIIGHRDAVREWRQAVDRGLHQMQISGYAAKALTIDASSRLWQKAPAA